MLCGILKSRYDLIELEVLPRLGRCKHKSLVRIPVFGYRCTIYFYLFTIYFKRLSVAETAASKRRINSSCCSGEDG
jgi:hypothetical protein